MPSNNDATAQPSDPLNVGELISLAQAADLSGFTYNFLKEIAQSGRLKAKKIGRNWATTEAAIEEYKKNRTYIRKNV